MSAAEIMESAEGPEFTEEMEDGVEIINTSDMCAQRIDVTAFAQYPAYAQKKWVQLNRLDMKLAISKRIKDCYLNNEPLPNLPAHKLIYASDNTRAAIVCSLKQKSQNINPLLPCLVYCAVRYGVSCHELLFGIKKPVILFGRTASFLRQMAQMPSDLQESICKTLEEGYLDVDTPYFILKERCLEKIFSLGQPKSRLEVAAYCSPYQWRAMIQLFATNVSPYAKDNQLNIDTTVGVNTMMLKYCSDLDLAADYFLLQDYSDKALLDGKPLDERQQRWLSLYLCASPRVQKKVIFRMSLALLDNNE